MDIRIVAYNLGENRLIQNCWINIDDALFASLGFVFCNGFCVIVQNSCTIDIRQLELVLVAFFLFLFFVFCLLDLKYFHIEYFEKTWCWLHCPGRAHSENIWIFGEEIVHPVLKIFKICFLRSVWRNALICLFKSVWCWSDFLHIIFDDSCITNSIPLD